MSREATDTMMISEATTPIIRHINRTITVMLWILKRTTTHTIISPTIPKPHMMSRRHRMNIQGGKQATHTGRMTWTLGRYYSLTTPTDRILISNQVRLSNRSTMWRQPTINPRQPLGGFEDGRLSRRSSSSTATSCSTVQCPHDCSIKYSTRKPRSAMSSHICDIRQRRAIPQNSTTSDLPCDRDFSQSLGILSCSL